jgi:hypothetical protein
MRSATDSGSGGRSAAATPSEAWCRPATRSGTAPRRLLRARDAAGATQQRVGRTAQAAPVIGRSAAPATMQVLRGARPAPSAGPHTAACICSAIGAGTPRFLARHDDVAARASARAPKALPRGVGRVRCASAPRARRWTRRRVPSGEHAARSAARGTAAAQRCVPVRRRRRSDGNSGACRASRRSCGRRAAGPHSHGQALTALPCTRSLRTAGSPIKVTTSGRSTTLPARCARRG